MNSKPKSILSKLTFIFFFFYTFIYFHLTTLQILQILKNITSPLKKISYEFCIFGSFTIYFFIFKFKICFEALTFCNMKWCGLLALLTIFSKILQVFPTRSFSKLKVQPQVLMELQVKVCMINCKHILVFPSWTMTR